jgi:hypothetical protein
VARQGVPLRSVGYEKASAKASLYAYVTLRRDHAGGKQ